MLEERTTKRGRRPAPFSLRLSEAERERLERLAGRQSIASFIKARIFDERGEASAAQRSRRSPRRPLKDEAALAQALAVLGQSRLAQNLNQIAKLAHIGALPVGEELLADLQSACADIQEMRVHLLQALGHRS